MSTVKISGNTYPVRDQLKALGGRWNPDAKAWMVPIDHADEARFLVHDAPKATHKFRAKCADCGAPSKGYYRCYDCNLERKVGGSRRMGGQSYHYTDANGRRQFVLGDED